MDAVHFHVRENNRTVKQVVCVAISVKLTGIKEVKAIYQAPTEEEALEVLDNLEDI
ncbi:MAG: transposase [Lachnospiraceae bacterium]|nr:transposase [Lachnospiraceae bacterium]